LVRKELADITHAQPYKIYDNPTTQSTKKLEWAAKNARTQEQTEFFKVGSRPALTPCARDFCFIGFYLRTQELDILGMADQGVVANPEGAAPPENQVTWMLDCNVITVLE
jgi:hypothetical protein